MTYDLVILVVASPGETNDLFAECWREYMDSYPNVNAFFVHANDSIEEELVAINSTILVKGSETSKPGVFKKTMAAMSHCARNMSFKYLLRTTLSSFIHIPRILNYLKEQSTVGFAAGPLITVRATSVQNQIMEFLGNHNDGPFEYLHGSCMMFSEDVVQYLVNAAYTESAKLPIESLVVNLPDDVVMSALIQSFPFVNTLAIKHQCKSIEDPSIYGDDIIHIHNKIQAYVTDNSIETRGHDIMNYIKQVRLHYNPQFMDYVDEVPEKKLVDCFTLKGDVNDMDMLEYHLSVMDEVADWFVLVESSKTSTGEEKPLHYYDNRERFAKYNDKIVYRMSTHPVYQPNEIRDGIKQLKLEEYDYIVIGDVNEIPDPETLAAIKNKHSTVQFASLRQDVYRKNMNSMVNVIWTKAKIISHHMFISQGSSPAKIRAAETAQVIQHGGWRLSGFMSDMPVLQEEEGAIVEIMLEDNTYLPKGYHTQFPFTCLSEEFLERSKERAKERVKERVEGSKERAKELVKERECDLERELAKLSPIIQLPNGYSISTTVLTNEFVPTK